MFQRKDGSTAEVHVNRLARSDKHLRQVVKAERIQGQQAFECPIDDHCAVEGV